MTGATETYRDLLPVIIERENATLPDGFDSWGIKSVFPDLRTRHGFQWAAPGGTSRSDHAIETINRSACPDRRGDGLCVATTWQGMASGGIPAITLLLVAYQSENVVGRDDGSGKLRVRGDVAVVAIVDGARLVQEAGAGADLRGAKLRGADLCDADLTGANLTGANLTCADLTDADLAGANLERAALRLADMSCTDLEDADLTGANLTGANLTCADLTYADLRRANLWRANLPYADLTGTNLSDADLTGANLTGAKNVTLPAGWTIADNGLATRDEGKKL